MQLNAARTNRGDVRLYLPLYVLIGLYTGARPGSILSLRWPQVDLEAGSDAGPFGALLLASRVSVAPPP